MDNTDRLFGRFWTFLKYFDDPDYEDDEKIIVCLDILYEDFESMSMNLYQEAIEKAVEFYRHGNQRRWT